MSSNEFASKKGTSLAKVFFYIILGIVALLLAIVLFTTVMTRSSAQPSTIFGYGFFTLTSDSLDKNVKNGSLVITKEIAESALKVGDMVAYKDGYDPAKNIVINTNSIAEIETIDNTHSFKIIADETPRGATDVIGKAIFSIPMFGSFIVFIKTPLGLICCVAFPLFLLLIFEIINLIKLSRRQKIEDDFLEGDLPSYMQIDIDEKTTDVFGEMVSTEDILDRVSNDYLFEQQDEKLELVEPKGPFVSLSYKKPNIVEAEVKSNSIYSTREFKLSDSEKTIADVKETPPNVEVALPVTKTTDFSASINTDTTNNFMIEGIAVKVQSDAVKLSLGDDLKSRDISITVTKDYTSVVVESGGYEVNFALFKDETDKEQKVIIQKKNKF
ncbi:MAG: hypothetical protein WAX04_05420 [Oscillospiraceae bacterium]